MGRAKVNHFGPHKYERQKLESGKSIFKCGFPGCTHFVYENLIYGRISACWRCGEQFIITKKAARIRYMHCVDCTKTKNTKQSEALSNAERLLENL